MDQENVKQISQVARIKLSDEELKSLCNEMDMLLAYFGKVQEIDIEEVEEKTSYMHGISNSLRDDEVKEQDEDTKEMIRSEFTKREGNILVVPKSLK
ncbi:MAG: Asp-tRNA(Asn)/Glu-tRNA(Gln) amidotransferase subunit GatC [Candidatus Micrarchaeia archaeon]